ncbi:MAG: coproporphyrinogen dehydrogenase HemZ, partial [Clostridia bacterium]|nr:coproporphyrinogen dehydrogenase HemZ [Clostridia bacterium]
YCSFVSSAAVNNIELMEEYFINLLEEIKYTSKIFSSLNLKLKTVYIGGGTPTTYSPEKLDKIIKTVKEYFDFSFVEEFTVEAGRPDTITKEKLFVLKENNINRISVNPQTLNQKVLDKMGRRHTVENFFEAYEMAKSMNFDSINTDLIAGLEEDTFESFCHTVDKICELSPENVTLHTLYLKKASDLYSKINQFDNFFEVNKMIEYFYSKMNENDYIPYYMYKQKNTLSNHENTGFARNGKHCLYNIYMMEEFHSVFALGAGGVTKLVTKDRNRIERVFNYKYPMEYNKDFEKILRDKELIKEFYNEKYQGNN